MQNEFVAYQKGYPLNNGRKLKKNLDRLVETGVPAQADEPTDWVNQMEVAIKRDVSLRICVDPRSLNIALKREH